VRALPVRFTGIAGKTRRTRSQGRRRALRRAGCEAIAAPRRRSCHGLFASACLSLLAAAGAGRAQDDVAVAVRALLEDAGYAVRPERIPAGGVEQLQELAARKQLPRLPERSVCAARELPRGPPGYTCIPRAQPDAGVASRR
jgi:hypothetical protein